MILVRPYLPEDAKSLWSLFFDTIHTVNRKDYSQAQVEAWAPQDFDLVIWSEKMRLIQPIVAEIDGVIVGYSDLQADGLIDHFFCHKDYQGKGVGRALMSHILELAEEKGINKLYSNVSLTAKPFFEYFGFVVSKAQTLEVRGQILRNFLMKKSLHL